LAQVLALEPAEAMGSGPSLQVIPESDSIADTGTKVVLSEDLSGITDYDTLMDGLVEQLKNPLRVRAAYAVKTTEITEKSGPEDFVIKITLDYKKLEAIGSRVDGTGVDPVVVHNWVTVDRAAGTIKSRVIQVPGEAPAESEDKPLYDYHTTVNRDPFRIECYFVKAGVRHADDLCVRGLLHTVDPVVRLLREQKVKVQKDMPSRSDPSKIVAMSEPLDSQTSMEHIVDKFWWAIGDMPENDRVQILSRTEEIFKYMVGNLELTFSFDKEGKQIEGIGTQGGEQKTKIVYRFLADPLQLEAWSEETATGVRHCGVAFARQTSLLLNKALVKAQSWFG